MLPGVNFQRTANPGLRIVIGYSPVVVGLIFPLCCLVRINRVARVHAPFLHRELYAQFLTPVTKLSTQ